MMMRTVTYLSIRPFYVINNYVIGRKQRRCKMHLLNSINGCSLYVNYVCGVNTYGSIHRIHPVFSYRIKNVRVGSMNRERAKHGHRV